MQQQLVRLAGSAPFNAHAKAGAVDPHKHINVTVKLRRKTEDGLPTLEEFIAGKRARGLTRQALGDKYGASPDDAAAVRKWAVDADLSVVRSDLALRQIQLVGSAAALESAFGVKLTLYKDARAGGTFRGHDGDVHIPASLVGKVTGVFGLSDMRVVRRRHGKRHTPAVANHAAAAAGDPKAQFPGAFFPNEVSALYQFPPTQGDGQRVAVLEFGGGFDPATLADYFTNTLHLPQAPAVNPILLLGATMNLQDEASGEVYLDIEVIGGMAPKATIDVFFAPWSGEGYLTAIERAVHNDDYAAVSISYGLDEDFKSLPGNEAAWPALNQHIEEAFRDAAAIGLPLFVSSGDQGSSCDRGAVSLQGQSFGVTARSPLAHAAYPASSVYATAVGGTLLYAKNGAIDQEVVWNELGPAQQGEYQNEQGKRVAGQYFFGDATGGGVSDRYPPPSYQSAAGVNPKSANPGNAPGRGVPDVAGNAGSTTGYLISNTLDPQQPPIVPVGGTSAAAPMWAALAACLGESLQTAFGGRPPPFFFNDFVYANGASGAFRDIVGGRDFTLGQDGFDPGAFKPIGDNQSAASNGYSAAPGYDLCTGWGSPNGVALLALLVPWLRAHAQGVAVAGGGSSA